MNTKEIIKSEVKWMLIRTAIALIILKVLERTEEKS